VISHPTVIPAKAGTHLLQGPEATTAVVRADTPGDGSPRARG
jgi:hypothetical protein